MYDEFVREEREKERVTAINGKKQFILPIDLSMLQSKAVNYSKHANTIWVIFD